MNKLIEIALIIGAFLMYLFLRIENFGIWWWILENTGDFAPIFDELIRGLPLFLVVLLLRDEKQFLRTIFNWKSLLTALVIAFLYALPLVYFVCQYIDLQLFEYYKYPRIERVVVGFLINVYYFAFFYRLLVQKTKLGYLSATLLLCAISMCMHGLLLNDPWYGYHWVLDIFLFSYLYAEWKNNLWLVFCIDFLIKGIFTYFFLDKDMCLPYYEHITLVLYLYFSLIIATILYKYIRKIPFVINRKTIFWKNNENISHN